MNVLRTLTAAALLGCASLCAPSRAETGGGHAEPALAAEPALHAPPGGTRAPAPVTPEPAPAPAPSAAVQPLAPFAGAEAAPDEVARSLLVLAARMQQRGEPGAAETAFEEILDSGASEELKQEALLKYAEYFRETGRNPRAAAVYEKFLAEYPDSLKVPTVMVALGRTLRDMGAFNLALARFYSVLNSTLAVSPESVASYRGAAQLAKFEIAETHYQQGDYAAAGKYFGRIKLLDLPAEEQARVAFREAYALYMDGKLDQAVGALRAFVVRFPAHASVQEGRYLLCMSLRRLGRTQEALNETLVLLRNAQATAAANRDQWAYWQRKTGNQLANDFYEQGDFSAALAVYSTLSELRPDPAWRWPALYQVGLCYERLRQGDRAAASYRAILAEAQAAAKAGGAGPEGDDVSKMAEWRLGQIEWSAGVDKAVRSVEQPAPAGNAS